LTERVLIDVFWVSVDVLDVDIVCFYFDRVLDTFCDQMRLLFHQVDYWMLNWIYHFRCRWTFHWLVLL